MDPLEKGGTNKNHCKNEIFEYSWLRHKLILDRTNPKKSNKSKVFNREDFRI